MAPHMQPVGVVIERWGPKKFRGFGGNQADGGEAGGSTPAWAVSEVLLWARFSLSPKGDPKPLGVDSGGGLPRATTALKPLSTNLLPKPAVPPPTATFLLVSTDGSELEDERAV